MTSHPLIFDIETIGDITADSRDEIAALAAGRELLPDAYAALCPPLARVVCDYVAGMTDGYIEEQHGKFVVGDRG